MTQLKKINPFSQAQGGKPAASGLPTASSSNGVNQLAQFGTAYQQSGHSLNRPRHDGRSLDLTG